MENKTEVKVEAMSNEELDKVLQAMSEASSLPRGLVDDIFNLGVKAERERQTDKALRRLAKKEKKPKEKLSTRIARRLGYAPIPKEESKKDEKKN